MSDFIISEEDWSLYSKGKDDQKRHLEKVEEAIKNNFDELLSQKEIIINNSSATISMKELNQYKIVYNYRKQKFIGMGNGDTQLGDIIARESKNHEKNIYETYPTDKNGKKEGSNLDGFGLETEEVEVNFEDVSKILFEDLELPNLIQKNKGEIETTSYEFNDIGKIGINGNIHKKRTLMQAFKRNALNGKSSFYPVIPEDLRYRTYNEIKKPDTNAIIIVMMDTSGSMGIWEKYMARSTMFWIQKFLETKYENVEIRYISHHTEAKEVNEKYFYGKAESGGTICSSALRLANQIIDKEYPLSENNIFLFHASDGDNLTSDNTRYLKLLKKMLNDKITYFGYIELNQYNRHSTFMNVFKNLYHPNFDFYVLHDRKHIYNAIKYYFRKRSL